MDRIYYLISVGIVRFPPDKLRRMQAYKALQSALGIHLSDIQDSGGFDAPYYVSDFVLRTEKDDDEFPGGIPEIETEVSMKDKWIYFDPTTLFTKMKMLKSLEELECKMIYMAPSHTPLAERIPEEYLEDFVCNIEWFKMVAN